MTHKKSRLRTAALLLLACLLCLSVSVGAYAGQETPAPAGRYADYEAFSGYAYFESNGQLKYWIEFGEDFLLHFVFRQGETEVDEIYTLFPARTASAAEQLTIRTVTDSQGNDVSHFFVKLEFQFSKEDEQVVMLVERDGRTVSGGVDSNIMSGEYTLTPSYLVSAEPEVLLNELEVFRPGQLASLAQRYYGLHYGYFPPEADITDNGDGTYLIHLYETVDNGDGTYHTVSSAWYMVDAYGSGTDKIMGTPIDLMP